MCYIYPAVFYREADGRYSVIFPDLNDLATYGNDFADAFAMAQEACGQYLFNELKEGNVLPVASSIEDVIAEEDGAIVNMVDIDLKAFERKYGEEVGKEDINDSWVAECIMRGTRNQFFQSLAGSVDCPPPGKIGRRKGW